MGLTGAILGDIAGSRIEFLNEQFLDVHHGYELFQADCSFTDDTVLSLATVDAILNRTSFANSYRKFGRKYPDAGYGGMFEGWLFHDNQGAYNSFGNGSAMRASFIGEYADNADAVKQLASESAECTHNHPEGIKGAWAAAYGVFLGKQRRYTNQRDLAADICDTVGYVLPKKRLEDIRPTIRFDVTCQGSIPLAMMCFMESDSYESCIRNVLSMRCDRDTVACIAGGIAESFYGSTGFDDARILKLYLDEFLFDVWRQSRYAISDCVKEYLNERINNG